jgi:hypothetical protein
VNRAIQDRVADDFVPAIHGELGSDHRRAIAIARFEDLQETIPGVGVERLQRPTIEIRSQNVAAVRMP